MKGSIAVVMANSGIEIRRSEKVENRTWANGNFGGELNLFRILLHVIQWHSFRITIFS